MLPLFLASRWEAFKARLHAGRRLRDLSRERDELSRPLQASRADGLTGLMNRIAFADAMRAHRTSGQPGSLLVVDLDGFKLFNDTFGHTVGDALLQQFASRLSGWARPGALVARLGGDEFVVFYPGMAEPEAWAQCESLLTLVREPVVVHGRPHCITASIGLADCQNLGSDDVLRRADIAVYAAKHRGRNQAVAYGAALETLPQARRQLASIVVQLQHQLAAVRDEARTDALTGLSNRRSLEEAMETIQRSGAPLGLAFVDLDHFGAINKAQGDAAGDQVLRQVATALRAAVREDDLVFRKGGEEFVVLMPGVTGQAATQAAARMLDAIRSLGIANPGGSGGGILTATIGVSATQGSTGCWTVLEHASAVAMEAKTAGSRNAVHERLPLELRSAAPGGDQ